MSPSASSSPTTEIDGFMERTTNVLTMLVMAMREIEQQERVNHTAADENGARLDEHGARLLEIKRDLKQMAQECTEREGERDWARRLEQRLEDVERLVVQHDQVIGELAVGIADAIERHTRSEARLRAAHARQSSRLNHAAGKLLDHALATHLAQYHADSEGGASTAQETDDALQERSAAAPVQDASTAGEHEIPETGQGVLGGDAEGDEAAVPRRGRGFWARRHEDEENAFLASLRQAVGYPENHGEVQADRRTLEEGANGHPAEGRQAGESADADGDGAMGAGRARRNA